MINLTRQQQLVILLVIILLLLGWTVKLWRTAHPQAQTGRSSIQ